MFIKEVIFDGERFLIVIKTTDDKSGANLKIKTKYGFNHTSFFYKVSFANKILICKQDERVALLRPKLQPALCRKFCNFELVPPRGIVRSVSDGIAIVTQASIASREIPNAK